MRIHKKIVRSKIVNTAKTNSTSVMINVDIYPSKRNLDTSNVCTTTDPYSAHKVYIFPIIKTCANNHNAFLTVKSKGERYVCHLYTKTPVESYIPKRVYPNIGVGGPTRPPKKRKNQRQINRFRKYRTRDIVLKEEKR